MENAMAMISGERTDFIRIVNHLVTPMPVESCCFFCPQYISGTLFIMAIIYNNVMANNGNIRAPLKVKAKHLPLFQVGYGPLKTFYPQ